MSDYRSLAICIPARDERENLSELLPEIDAVLGQMALSKVDVIVFDDGSKDGTLEYLQSVVFSRFDLSTLQSVVSVGKSAALHHALGAALELGSDVVITMDGDCQDDPGQLADFLAAVGSGSDVVNGRRLNREHSFGKRLSSRAFNGLVRKMTGLQYWDINSGYKAFTRTAALVLQPYLYGELHRVILVIAAWSGLRISEVQIVNRARKAGNSHYGIARAWRGLFDLITVQLLRRYHARPSHLFTGVGLALITLGSVFSLAYLVTGIAWKAWVADPGYVVLALSCLGFGSVFLGFGFLAELIVFSSKAPNFSVIRRMGLDSLPPAGPSEKQPPSAKPNSTVATDVGH